MKTRYKKKTVNEKGKRKRRTIRGGKNIVKNIDKSLGSTIGRRIMLASSKTYNSLRKKARIEPNEFLRKIKNYEDFVISMDLRNDAQMDNSVEIDESLRIIQDKIKSIKKTKDMRELMEKLATIGNDPVASLEYLYQNENLRKYIDYYLVYDPIPYNINLIYIKNLTKEYILAQECPDSLVRESICDKAKEEKKIGDIFYLDLLYYFKYNLELARFSIREHKDKTKNFILENRKETVKLPTDLIIIPNTNLRKSKDFNSAIDDFVDYSKFNTQYNKLSKTYQTIKSENEGIKKTYDDAKEQLDMEDAQKNLSQLRKENPTDLIDSSRQVSDNINILKKEKTKLNRALIDTKFRLLKPDEVKKAETEYAKSLEDYKSALYETTGVEPKKKKKYNREQIKNFEVKKEEAFQKIKLAKKDKTKIEEEKKEKKEFLLSIKSIKAQLGYIDKIIKILEKQTKNKPVQEEEEEIDLSEESADYTFFYYLSLWDSRIKKCEQENKPDCQRGEFNKLIAQISHVLTEKLIAQVFHEINLYYEHNNSNTKPLYKFLKAYADTKDVSADLHEFLEQIDDYLEAAELKENEKEVVSDIQNFSKIFVDLIINNTNDIEQSAHKVTDNILYPKIITQLQARGGYNNSALTIKKIIAYLISDDVTKKINLVGKSDEEKEQMNKKREIVIDTLKKQVSHNYVDYEIDNIFDIFFPKAPKGDDPNIKPPNKIIETNGKLKTFMYSYPVDPETLAKKGDKSKQENNPFGFQMSVFRRDPENIQFSDILGVEMWLSILNMSGSNTNYIQDYYFKDNKPNPMYVNEINIKERKKNPFVSD